MYGHSIKLEARYPQEAEVPYKEVQKSVLKVLFNWLPSHDVTDCVLGLQWSNTTDGTDQVVVLTVFLETENKLDILDFREDRHEL